MATNKKVDELIYQQNPAAYATLEALGKAWTNAKTQGERDAARRDAEHLRNAYGYATNPDGTGYYSLTTPTPDNLSRMYEQSLSAQREAQAAATRQGVNRLQSEIPLISKAYDNALRDIYTKNQQDLRSMPQYLNMYGITGGAAESSLVNLNAAYGNNRNTLIQDRENALRDVQNRIIDLQNQGDMETANMLAGYYSQLAQQANNDRSYDFQKQQYRDSRNDTAYDRALSEAQFAAQYGDFSRLKALGYNTDMVERVYLQSLNNGSSSGKPEYKTPYSYGGLKSNTAKRLMRAFLDEPPANMADLVAAIDRELINSKEFTRAEADTILSYYQD